MAGLLPLVRGSATCLYPVTRRITFWTDLAIAQNASEQRARKRPALTELVLPYSRINAADLATMRAFVGSQKGTFDTSWAVVLGRSGLGTISAGSSTLTLTSTASGPAVSTDTGNQIAIVGAGPSGATLVTTYTYSSPTSLTLGTTASTSVSGADTRWGIYLGHMTLTDPQFPATEEDATRTSYSFTLRARQTQNPSATASAAGSPFPTMANGLITQLPYVRTQRYQVTLNDNPVGQRYSWNWLTGTGGFLSGSLRGWELSAPVLSDADLATWEAHFRAQFGMFGQFSFTDPEDATDHASCRYATDAMEIKHLSPDINSVALKILETN